MLGLFIISGLMTWTGKSVFVVLVVFVPVRYKVSRTVSPSTATVAHAHYSMNALCFRLIIRLLLFIWLQTICATIACFHTSF